MRKDLEFVKGRRELIVAIVVDIYAYKGECEEGKPYQGPLDVLFGDAQLKRKDCDYFGPWGDRYDLYSNHGEHVPTDAADFMHGVYAMVNYGHEDLNSQCDKENLIKAVNAFINESQLEGKFAFYSKEVNGKKITGLRYADEIYSTSEGVSFTKYDVVKIEDLTVEEMLLAFKAVNEHHETNYLELKEEDSYYDYINSSRKFIRENSLDKLEHGDEINEESRKEEKIDSLGPREGQTTISGIQVASLTIDSSDDIPM